MPLWQILTVHLKLLGMAFVIRPIFKTQGIVFTVTGDVYVV